MKIIGSINLPVSSLRSNAFSYNKCDKCGDLIHPSIVLDEIRVLKHKNNTWYSKYVCPLCSSLYYS